MSLHQTSAKETPAPQPVDHRPAAGTAGRRAGPTLRLHRSTDARSRWRKCPSCDAYLYDRRLARDLMVCAECSHHFRLSIDERLAQLVDAASFEEHPGVTGRDVLGFVDAKPYTARLEEARWRTGRQDAAAYGTATIEGRRIAIALLDFAFMGGSMGAAVGEVVTRAAELALAERIPLLLVSASGGARMQEGALSLMQMAKTAQAVARLHEEGILCLSVITDPTFGGVSASFAALGDVLIAEPRALHGFAGPGVIEQTIGEALPPGFQTAEHLLDHGMIDRVEPRERLRACLGLLLDLCRRPAEPRLPRASGVRPITDAGASPGPAVADVLRLARHSDRPTTLDYIRTVFDDFVELHGDRLYGDDPAIVGGPARLGDARVMVVGQQKGHSTPERIRRNFGMANPEGYRKALRLMRQAARLGLPVVTFIDTPGAHPGVGAEERGQARAIAESIVELARLPVPVVALIIGEGGSGGALALGVGDRVLMLENAYYSVISPEGCSAILWRDTGAALEAAEALGLQAPDLLRLGIVDAVVPEPPGGAHRDFPAAAANVRTAIIDSLEFLLPRPAEDLMASRYTRFRSYGSEEPVRPISAVVGGWADEGRRRLATGSASRAVS